MGQMKGRERHKAEQYGACFGVMRSVEWPKMQHSNMDSVRGVALPSCFSEMSNIENSRRRKPHCREGGHEGGGMCGRHMRRSDKHRIAEAFHIGKLPRGSSYCPTTTLPPLPFNRLEQQPIDLLKPYPAEEMSAALANPAVGNVRNNAPSMLSHIE
jgi:hypothetical protein